MPLKTSGTCWSYTLGTFCLWNNTASSFSIEHRLWSPGASRNNSWIFYELLLGMSWAADAPGAERGSVACPEERGGGGGGRTRKCRPGSSAEHLPQIRGRERSGLVQGLDELTGQLQRGPASGRAWGPGLGGLGLAHPPFQVHMKRCFALEKDPQDECLLWELWRNWGVLPECQLSESSWIGPALAPTTGLSYPLTSLSSLGGTQWTTAGPALKANVRVCWLT